jgi:hypothetical protein
MTRQTSIQLTDATQRQVEILKAQGFGTFTDIVRVAIDRLYRDEAENTLNMVTVTHTYVIEDSLDESGSPFMVEFCDKSGPSLLGPYIDESFADKEAAIAHAESLVGMTFDWEPLIQATMYNGMRVVWASDREEESIHFAPRGA